MQINITNLRKYFAEYIGTFFLALIVSSSIIFGFAIATPTLAAIMLAFFVYTIGSISGCHINPAVTIGLLSIKQIRLKEALNYIIAQLLGATSALLLARYFNASPDIAVSGELPIFIAEFLGTLLLAFGVASVVYKQVEATLSGLVIGIALFMGLAVASTLGSAAFLNPAVMIALTISSPVYLLAQVLGSVFGFRLYKGLFSKEISKLTFSK